MARFSFGIFGQGSGDLQPNLAIEMKQSTTVKASTSPVSPQLTITDNGDGTYYVDALPSGNYDIYVAGALQDEMTNQLVLQEDVVTHISDATKHRLVQDDGTGASAGDGNTTTLWSANQIHDWVLTNYEPKNSALLVEGEIDNASLQYSGGTVHIKDLGVTTAKLASSAVTAGKIAPDAVTNAKMADNAINTDELVNNAVTEGKIIDNAVTRDKIVDNAINPDKIAHHNTYGVLTFDSSGAPSFGAMTANHIQDNAITTAKINNNAVNTDKLLNSAVTEAKIGTGAVTAGKLGALAVETAKIQTGAVTTTKIGNSEVKTVNIQDNGVTSAKIANGAIDTTQLADGAVTAGKLDASVDITLSADSVDDTHVKVMASGAGSSGAVQSWSAGVSPAFLSSRMEDKEFRYDRMLFTTTDFDTTSSADSGSVAGQYIKIKQDFSSQNYISSTKTLNQNLDVLDQRLGYLTQFSGTEGLYLILSGMDWSWNKSRDGNGTPVDIGSATPDKPKIVDGTQVSQTWYGVHMATIYKVPDIRQVALYARGHVSNTGSGTFNGYMRIRVEGDNFSSISQDSTAFDTTDDSTVRAVYKDMTTIQNYKIYNVWVDYKFHNSGSAGTKFFQVDDWVCVGKRQITTVSGLSDAGQDSPL